jgi:hypothetical protein
LVDTDSARQLASHLSFQNSRDPNDAKLVSYSVNLDGVGRSSSMAWALAADRGNSWPDAADSATLSVKSR